MRSLSALKKAAIDAEAAWQEARAKVLKRIGPYQQLQDCSFCARIAVANRDHPCGWWRCACSPDVIQKAARPAA